MAWRKERFFILVKTLVLINLKDQNWVQTVSLLGDGTLTKNVEEICN